MRPLTRAGQALLASAALTVIAVSPAAAGPVPAGPARADTTAPTVRVEYFPEPGAEGRQTRVAPRSPQEISGRARSLAPDKGAAAAAVRPQARTGPVEDRLDVVIIGDGYTADQQEDFHADAAARWADVMDVEPYRSYEGLFNVWTVDAVSRESGISGESGPDDVKDTALGSYFWCDSVERLICTDLDKAESYASRAPDADLVVVVANSAKYGGAGYFDLDNSLGYTGLSTLSSDNEQSSLIAAHEFAHSVGLLADEYAYDGYGAWPDPEPAEANTTVHTEAELRATRTKWYRWLGEADPSGGTVGTYEGAYYHPEGIYRPTENSIMRSLGTDRFNLPGREAMIAGFYRDADLLTALTPPGRPVRRTGQLRVEPAPLATDGLSDVRLRWYVDGVEVPKAAGRTHVVPARLGVRRDGHRHTVTVRAIDATTAVRDPGITASTADSLTWTVRR
ncbi:M64 family metallopeptidase [Streptomyces sp. NPDC008313]|uniref:M64 family metallopeptidase n=1 Tax=Streptomyces sp. NPDC008313 TaxID=3364826 RepID=UPI0036ED61BC